MITGAIKSQIDQIWNAFWSGGISNPLEVIEQITYLLFLRRLDDLHTLEENKATRLKEPMARRVFPAGKDTNGRPYAPALSPSLGIAPAGTGGLSHLRCRQPPDDGRQTSEDHASSARVFGNHLEFPPRPSAPRNVPRRSGLERRPDLAQLLQRRGVDLNRLTISETLSLSDRIVGPFSSKLVPASWMRIRPLAIEAAVCRPPARRRPGM